MALKGRRKEDYSVPFWRRKKVDEGDQSNAIDNETGDDREEMQRHKPGGDLYSDRLVRKEDLA
jgi:hypothetical protein